MTAETEGRDSEPAAEGFTTLTVEGSVGLGGGVGAGVPGGGDEDFPVGNVQVLERGDTSVVIGWTNPDNAPGSIDG